MKKYKRTILFSVLLSGILFLQAAPAQAQFLLRPGVPDYVEFAKGLKKAWKETPPEYQTIIKIKMYQWMRITNLPNFFYYNEKIKEEKDKHEQREKSKICIDKNGNFCNGYQPRRRVVPQQEQKPQEKKTTTKSSAKKSRGR